MASIIRLDDLKSVRGAGHIYDVQSTEVLENGMVGHVGDHLEGQREIRELTKPATATLTTRGAVLVAHDEIVYDETTQGSNALQNFSIDADTPARAYELAVGDIFSITKDGIDLLAEDAVKDNYVIMQDGSYKLVESATIPVDTKFVGKIITASEKVGVNTVIGKAGTLSNVMDFVVIEVIRNQEIL